MVVIDYKFGKLEDQILEICDKHPIDYGKIKELIAQGADLNKVQTIYDDPYDGGFNLLSAAICEFPNAKYYDIDGNEIDDRNICDIRKKDLMEMIDFFLTNGFDLSAKNGEYGDNCLAMLDGIEGDLVLDAAKRLLDAGAVTVEKDQDDTLYGVLTSADYNLSLGGRPEEGQICFALYKILERARNSESYMGIQGFHFAEGKVVRKVYFVNPQEKDKISQNLFQNAVWVCHYDQDLCFELDNCWLYVSKYCECYVDKEKPTEQLVDASEHFAHLLGYKIVKIGSFKDANEADKFMEQIMYGHRVAALELYYDKNANKES